MKQKTKKIILLISTILTLLINTCYIFALFTGDLQLEVVEGFDQIDSTTQVAFIAICVLVNLIALGFILKNAIAHKKKIIVLNVIQLLFGTLLNMIFAIINISILSIKTKDIEELKDKKELPILEDITKHKWYVYFIIFVFLFIICYTPATDILPIPKTKIAAIIATIITYIIQISLLAIPIFNELKRDFIIFKNNFKLYLDKILPSFGIIILIYFISAISLTLLIKEDSTNQAFLSSLPIYITGVLAIFIAPLTEEIMFRCFMKKFIKNNILFVILSSFIFGSIHVFSANSLQQVFYILPYSILGFAFSLNYVKTKNIVSNIFLHSAWNTLATIVMFFSNSL